MQSAHKAVGGCKLVRHHHRRTITAMEIRANSQKKTHGAIVALMQTTYEQVTEELRRPKTLTLRLCNQRTRRYELANWSATTIAVQRRYWKFAQIPCKTYKGTIVALIQTAHEKEAEGMRRPKTLTLRLCNERTKR